MLKKSLSIIFTENLYTWLKKESTTTGFSMSSIIKLLIIKAIEEEKKSKIE